MDSVMENTLEKIKLQEQEKETKLKEKRAIEMTIATLKRNLHETMLVTRKLKEEVVEATARADATNAELIMAEALRSSLVTQLEASNKQLQQLKIESEQGMSKVWAMRNELSNEVYKVSDQCDIWALFTKPKYIETTIKPKKKTHDIANQANQMKGLLESAQKKRQSLIIERDRLLNEPDFGEEFKRINNALRYSEEMAAQNMRE